MPDERTCPPAEWGRIHRARKRWGIASSICLGLSLPLALFIWVTTSIVFGSRMTPAEAPRARFIWGLWVALLALFIVAASACYARRKGRSAAWGLAGLGGYIGLALLWFLPSRCGYCGWTERARDPRCRECRAPW